MNDKIKTVIKTVVPRPILNRVVRILMWLYDRFASPTSHSVRRVFANVKIETLEFFNKKTPQSECYPYSVHFPAVVKNVPLNSKRLYLVGDNWIDAPNAPYALCVGFNDWKLGFISAYLPEFRTAFAPGSFGKFKGKRNLRYLDPQPDAIYTWGYKTPPWLEKYAKKSGIPFTRIEDGFVRSAKLGASHTTPYSLVFDTQGMHYHSHAPNDLSDILENYNFKQDPKLLSQASEARSLLIENQISKYNPPNFERPSAHYHVKTRKKVLVLGQVESDAAVKMGNPKGWSMVNMVRLAKLENPDADIFYRPHPEVYQGYQKSIFKNWQVESYAKIIPPSVPYLKSLEGVDQVYTITSLSGLEALLRGIKVTVLGTPFYAGRGLTDDRAQSALEEGLSPRKLSLDELFAAVYLKYPKYLANLDNSFAGLKTTIIRILADKKYEGIMQFGDLGSLKPKELDTISKSAIWPKLLFDKTELSKKADFDLQKSLQQVPILSFLKSNRGQLAHQAIASLYIGSLDTDEAVDLFLKRLRDVVSPEVFNTILMSLAEDENNFYLIKHFSWLLQKYDSPAATKSFLNLKILEEKQKQSKNTISQSDEVIKENLDNDVDVIELSTDLEDEMLNTQLLTEFSLTEYNEAIETATRLLLKGNGDAATILLLAEIAKLTFDFESCYSLSTFLQSGGSVGSLHKASTYMTETAFLNSSKQYLEDIAFYFRLKPEKFVNVQIELNREKEGITPGQFESHLEKFLIMDNDHTVQKAQGFLSVNQPKKAIRIIEEILKTRPNNAHLAVMYSKALTFSERITEAKTIIFEAVKLFPDSETYREAMRLCVLTADYERGLSFLTEAINLNLNIGDMSPRKIYLGARMPFEAHETFKKFHLKHNIKSHYHEKYCETPFESPVTNSFFGIPIFGPGDEIRFASIYNSMTEQLPHKKIVIGCSPRLLPLFKRSFSNIELTPVNRIRNSDAFNISDYDQVRSSALIGALDNNGAEHIKSCDDFLLITDLLGDVLNSYEAFPGAAYLKADARKTTAYKKRLPKGKPLIGLSWRSSLTTHSRNEHYVTIQELAPILALEGFQFVNLQYDDCSEELAWAEQHYPGKIVNLEDIDQYNDFDSVAALMKAMDLIIAPATTVVELAGALGCPTWLLSNSSELHWRKLEGTLTDVWHNSIRHVEGDILQDKESLIEKLKQNLLNFS